MGLRIGDRTNVRKVISTGPRRTVFYIIVSGHMFGDDSNGVSGVLGQKVRGGQPRDSSPVGIDLAHGLG